MVTLTVCVVNWSKVTKLAPEASTLALVPDPLKFTLLVPVSTNFPSVMVPLPVTSLAPETLITVDPDFIFSMFNLLAPETVQYSVLSEVKGLTVALAAPDKSMLLIAGMVTVACSVALVKVTPDLVPMFRVVPETPISNSFQRLSLEVTSTL